MNRERALCGVPPDEATPMTLWRDHLETQLAERIVVASALSRDFYVGSGCEPDRIRVIWPGISAAARVPRRRRATTRFLFVASDAFRKGIRVLLEAWRRVPGRSLELLCLFPPETLTSPLVLRHLVADRRIVHRRLMPQRQFLQLYAESDVVVLPSFEDGFPYVVADAMARGLPPLVSTTSGIHEAIDNGSHGIVVGSGEVESLAAAIDRLASRPALRAALGDGARERAHDITWREFSRRWHAVLDEVRPA